MSDLRIRIFDGTRQLFSVPTPFLVTLRDGRGNDHATGVYNDPIINITNLPFGEGGVDNNYSIVVSADNFQQAGIHPVHLSDKVPTTRDIMLIPKDPGFSFVNALWCPAQQAYPFLASGAPDPSAAQTRYEDLLDKNEEALACFLNIAEAMRLINLPQLTPLDYLKELVFQTIPGVAAAPARDRFYAWCDPNLIHQVQQAGSKVFVPAPITLHPGATRSWKQVSFDEANVQLTFHEKTHHPNHPEWILVEPDIDYYANSLNHISLEVLPNGLKGTLTNPILVYVLRWMAGRAGSTPDFAPLYTLT